MEIFGVFFWIFPGIGKVTGGGNGFRVGPTRSICCGLIAKNALNILSCFRR
ncbi:hypothetical protein COLO4_07136 [Corchorus olitorius]|uniref:Uncharacterized protein n=1 Tax=Corchorus olitorius TaxID=93759 RepID=A0A1R3KKS4_9ROSI|nr:hypothetical protein COLO4_07136 [Corchorus olitorius]